MENTTNPWFQLFRMLRQKNKFLLNQNLICANYGIYLKTCVISHQEYAAQTVNTFSKRCSAQ